MGKDKTLLKVLSIIGVFGLATLVVKCLDKLPRTGYDFSTTQVEATNSVPEYATIRVKPLGGSITDSSYTGVARLESGREIFIGKYNGDTDSLRIADALLKSRQNSDSNDLVTLTGKYVASNTFRMTNVKAGELEIRVK